MILLWNARGIGRKGFRRNINQIIREHNPSIIILTETRAQRDGVKKSMEGLPYDSFETVDPVGVTGKILVLWSANSTTLSIIANEPRVFHATIQVHNNSPFCLLAVYAPTKFKARLEL